MSAFQSRHYIRVGAVLDRVRPSETSNPVAYEQWLETCGEFAAMFSNERPGEFDCERFLSVCNGDPVLADRAKFNKL